MKVISLEELEALRELPDYQEYIISTKELDPEMSEVNAARVYLMMNSPFEIAEPEGEEIENE